MWGFGLLLEMLRLIGERHVPAMLAGASTQDQTAPADSRPATLNVNLASMTHVQQDSGKASLKSRKDSGIHSPVSQSQEPWKLPGE